MKKISIIIPCYNVEKYIEKCIDSVYHQTLDESEFELLIIDDESPDRSVEIATEITKNKTNVKIIPQANKGLGGARNTGILNATGTYLLFLDADDFLIPHVLEDLLHIAEKEELDILEFSAQGINAKGEIKYHFTNESEVFSSGIEYYNKVRYMNSACNKLYKRDFLKQNNILFIEKIFIEDFEFNTRCLVYARNIRATPLLAAQFLQSENSITRNTDDGKRRKMVSDIIFVINVTNVLYKEQSKSERSSLFYLERLNFLVATLFFQLFKNKAPYQEVTHLKSKLIKDQLFFVNHKIWDFEKNIFRLVFLKNLWLYPLVRVLLK